LRKRGFSVVRLPDPSTFVDWKDWARRTNLELERQLIATSANVPFFEFGTVKRDNNFTPAGAAIPWESKVYDNTNGMWAVAQATRLVVPPRAGDIKYGYGMVICNLAFTDPGGANNLTVRIRKNGATTNPSGVVARSIIAGFTPAINVVQPWTEVNAGDYFEVVVTRAGAGTADISHGTDTWAQLILGGPA
jgi:hypothetical protein